jgi:hypothetical protein
MFFVLYIGAPPTIGLLLLVPPPIICADAATADADTATANINANTLLLIFIPPVSFFFCRNLHDIRGARAGRFWAARKIFRRRLTRTGRVLRVYR